MKARLVARERRELSTTQCYEIVVWAVPHPVDPCAHAFKYRLVLISDGRRVIGFDNERGKGDHWHRDGVERPYEFISVERLLDDFFREVDAWIER